MITGAVVGLGVMLSIWFISAPRTAARSSARTLLNMAVFGAMISYVVQGVSFILLRRQHAAYRASLSQPARGVRAPVSRSSSRW